MRLTHNELRSQLHYDPETGIFTRIGQNAHKNCRLGRTLGWKAKNGYIMVNNGRKGKYYAHRLAWFYTYGVWPKEIDHINRVTTDNRIANLREVTRSRNNHNAPPNRKNTSGCRGVGFNKLRSKWYARIHVNKKLFCLGNFATREAAVEARRKAEEELCV